MATDEKLDTQPKRRRWRREKEAEEMPVEEDNELDDEEEDERGLTAPKGRATPGRRQQQAVTEDRGNFVTRPLRALAAYWQDVRSELGKVSWPTRLETLHLTRVVVGTTVASALVLGVITLLFTELFRLGVAQPLIFLGLFIIVVALLVMFVRRGGQRTPSY